MASPGREKDSRAARKRYVPPELKEFGRIADLTTALDSMGAMDGGTVMGLKRT
jgi:hypothetical protein